jgi:hypothetical protein
MFSSSSFSGQSQTANEVKPTKIALSGDSELETKVAGKTIRVVVSTYKVDLGSPNPTPPPTGEGKTNCTFSRFPCNQISNVRIWVAGKKLFVPRSVFADRADVGNMRIASEAGMYVLTLDGGDASEGYSLKVFFDAGHVKKRELYDVESNSLLQVTTYLPPPVLD